MPMNAVWVHIDGDRVMEGLEDALEKLEAVEGELALDFSAVRRMDASALGALDKIASAAESKGVGVVLRGTSVEVYKVLKLLKLAKRFSFTS